MNKLKILILEDDEKTCNDFLTNSEKRNDLEIVLTTNSCSDALDYLKSNPVDAAIVDIELNKGFGDSGLEFLAKAKNIQQDKQMIKILTTKIESEIIYETARLHGADIIFCKRKPDYSPASVLNTITMLRKSLITEYPEAKSSSTSKIKEETNNRLNKIINDELNKIGLKPHLKGRTYIHDAIYYLLENLGKDDAYYTKFLKDKYKVSGSSINNAIQSCINDAWRNTPYEDLLEHFNANTYYANGSPKPEEFIYYYVNKIKREI